MSSGEISTHALYTVGFILITLILAFAAIKIYLGWQDDSLNQSSCTAKLADYCSKWAENGYNDEPFDWDTTNPTNCGEFGIEKPVDSTDCE